jgi:hypothetical protein
MLEKYDDLVHFYGVIMEWVNKLHPHFLVVWYCFTNDQLSGYLKKIVQNSFKFSNDNCFASERIIEYSQGIRNF